MCTNLWVCLMRCQLKSLMRFHFMTHNVRTSIMQIKSVQDAVWAVRDLDQSLKVYFYSSLTEPHKTKVRILYAKHNSRTLWLVVLIRPSHRLDSRWPNFKLAYWCRRLVLKKWSTLNLFRGKTWLLLFLILCPLFRSKTFSWPTDKPRNTSWSSWL